MKTQMKIMGAIKTFKFSCNYFLAFLFFLFISDIQQTLGASQTTKISNNIYINFIRTSCSSTNYPSVCYNSLLSSASIIKTNPLKLTDTALSVTLKSARACSSLVSTLARRRGLSNPEKAVIRDCKEQFGDSIYHINRSVNALKNLKGSGRGDMKFRQMANIRTWVSAAITDADTCSDELEEMKVRLSLMRPMKKCVSNLVQRMSNSLALVNRLK